MSLFRASALLFLFSVLPQTTFAQEVTSYKWLLSLQGLNTDYGGAPQAVGGLSTTFQLENSSVQLAFDYNWDPGYHDHPYETPGNFEYLRTYDRPFIQSERFREQGFRRDFVWSIAYGTKREFEAEFHPFYCIRAGYIHQRSLESRRNYDLERQEWLWGRHHGVFVAPEFGIYRPMKRFNFELYGRIWFRQMSYNHRVTFMDYSLSPCDEVMDKIENENVLYWMPAFSGGIRIGYWFGPTN